MSDVNRGDADPKRPSARAEDAAQLVQMVMNMPDVILDEVA
jgi:hypothetical protein